MNELIGLIFLMGLMLAGRIGMMILARNEDQNFKSISRIICIPYDESFLISAIEAIYIALKLYAPDVALQIRQFNNHYVIVLLFMSIIVGLIGMLPSMWELHRINNER